MATKERHFQTHCATAFVMRSISAFLSLLAFGLSLASVDAQKVNRKIAFTKFGPAPTGYEKNDPTALSSGATKVFLGRSIPVQFRSFVKQPGGFTYMIKTKLAVYRVKFGFYEVSQCSKGARVFRMSANGKFTGRIDVFNSKGCKSPLYKIINNVKATGGVINIAAKAIRGSAPFLANVQIIETGSLSPLPSVKPPGGSRQIVKDLDAGGATDMKGAITGSTMVYPNVFPIAGTTQDSRYSRHRFGMQFTYILNVKPNTVYNVQLFFAESYMPGCKNGFRIFDVFVYDGGKPQSSGKALRNLDVFKVAGCQTAYSRSLNGIGVGPSGKIAIGFMSAVNNAMISALQITTSDGSFVPGTPKPSSPSQPSTTFVEVNAGGPGDKFIPGTKKESTASPVKKTASVGSSALKTARVGTEFTYSFNLKPGAYDVLLAFSENFDPNFCSKAGKRVFNVYVNDLIQLEGFDIFAQAGCRKGIEVLLKGHTVGAVDMKPLTIRFSGVVSNAQINYIRIKKAAQTCMPASTTGELSSDHAAHAVPGSYPPQFTANSPKSYVDGDGDGFVTVRIDGDGSHSHFFDSSNNIIGRITEYTWSIVETGEVISRQAAFMYKFPLGSTRLKLAVTDNSCTSDEAETTVTVTGVIQPGQYCYYYAGLSDFPKAGPDALSQNPQFSAVTESAQLGFPAFSFAGTKFAARCTFFLEVDKDSASSKISVATFGSGKARVYKGEDLIIDTTSSFVAQTSLAVGLIGFEVVYLRTTLAKPAKLHFLVNNSKPAASKITHDRKTVIPILSSITPMEGPIGGGTNVKVTGYGLFSPISVKFGGKSVPVLQSGRSPNQFFVESPPASKGGGVKIVAKSDSGVKSNSVNFAYGSTCDSISFTRDALLQADGSEVDFLELPTSAVIGQDGKIYMGTLGGTVQVLGYNSATLTTTSHCYSKPLKDANFKKNNIPAVRDILGITFHPRDKVLRPYISSSTIFWYDRERVERSNKKAWQNGAVDRLKPGTDPTDAGVCLVYDKRIVSGLPVSNHDHSVNGLLFTQTGDLLIAVGGYTNMGLPGYKLGGYWETHLSAAILIAKLSKPGFNGQIKYKFPDEPRKAKKISGDVELFVTGLRNTFAMTMTGKQEIYASDQGPNCGFGDTSSTCNDYDPAKAAAWNPDAEVDWKGKVKHGWVDCPYSLGRPDKMIHITKGSWYGHPNINRGGPECAWIDPYDHLTADDKPAPAKYKKPLVTLKSPVTGMREYRANHFCGKLRGELIMSTYKSGSTSRMGVNGGSVTSGPDEISTDGGITFVENARGDLIFPRLSEKNVFVLRPKVGPVAGLFIAGAVPFRHGKQGGTKIVIGGSNFGVMASVMIGTKKCAVTKSANTEIICTVPAHSGGLQSLTVTTSTSEKAVLADAVLYMNV